MRLQTLGALALPGSDLRRPKPLLLLAYLALEGPKDRPHLSELFWPAASDPAGSVRVALAQVRRAAPGAIADDGGHVRTTLDTDAVELIAAVRARRHHDVVAAYTGAFLAGFHLAGIGAEIEEWIYATRERLARHVRHAYLELAEAGAGIGDFAAAAALAGRAWDSAAGADAEASELGRLHALLVAGESPLAAEVALSAAEFGTPLVDERDAARERLLVDAPDDIAENALPHPASSFVGRDPEIVELVRMLTASNTRLVTLTGPGGTGKTRLALEVARHAQHGDHFDGGVSYVALESVRDAGSVPFVVARAVGCTLPATADPVAALATALGSCRRLLILDNCEHLAVGAFVGRLLRRVPELAVLATSRDRLGSDGEQRFPVEGLPPPPDDPTLADAAANDAVRLFVERARRSDVHFELDTDALPAVLEICRIVAYLPLGLELAAAWVRLLSVEEIAEELRKNHDLLTAAAPDVHDRHRSLRAAFEHSWQLLDPVEQDVFARLSVFEGGFTRHAASRVVGASIAQLASLADKSMIRRLGGGRYDRHPVVFGYAREKLAARGGEDVARAAHADYFLDLARDAEAKHRGGEQARWLQRLESETANLSAALDWSFDGGHPQTGLQLAAALFHFWYYRSHLEEGARWLERAVEVAARDVAWDALRSRLLSAAGTIADERGDTRRATELFEARLELARRLGDVTGEAAALNSLGVVAWGRREYDRARTLIEATITLRRQLGDPALLSPALNNLGLVALALRRLDDARSALEESLRISLDLDDTMGIAMARANLGAVALEAGDPDAAAAQLRQALPLYLAIGDRDGLAHGLEAVAALATVWGQATVAARLGGGAAAERESAGAALSASDTAIRDARLAPARAALGEAAFDAAWRAGGAVPVTLLVEEAVAVAARRPPSAPVPHEQEP